MMPRALLLPAAIGAAWLAVCPAYAQQPWRGGVESAPLGNPSQPGGPGVPPIMATPPGDSRQPAAPDPAVPGQATVGPSGDIEVVQPPSQKIANPTAVFSGLDKITGRITTFDVAINETVQYGALQITPRVCYTRPSTETQNTTGFVEVNEVTLQNEVKKLFGGWMFAASPGLHGVEHPIYDVWLIDCKQTAPQIASPGGQP